MNSRDDLMASERSRYVIGIDLGTTNSALCYVDAQVSEWSVRTFSIPQVTAPGQVENRETLPSFYYQASKGEFPKSALNVPWSDGNVLNSVGVFAREQGKLVPGRVVESAKSWLCHAGVDRTSALLPWRGAGDVTIMSPVDVSAAYLGHLRQAWDAAHPNDLLADQDVVITLPASFDEVARELTVRGAKKAGLNRVLLIEEPQAAFYAWIHAHEDDWQSRVSPGQNILVCDVGGGTSDFTLIRVRSHPEEEVQFHRMAVGNHLILGGDNLDLALAKHVEQRLVEGGGQLDSRQWGSLVRICRRVKEVLLSDGAPETQSINLGGMGRKLIGGGMQTEVTREEVREWLVEGFFPMCDRDAVPQEHRSGFQEFGLPYAADAAVTRYLAAFLKDHCSTRIAGDEHESSGRPDVVLFNGGVFVSPIIQSRVVDAIQGWYADGNPDWSPDVLTNPRHDLAVAHGAAYYGMVRRGEGVRIAAGLPRTYYIGVGKGDAAPQDTPQQDNSEETHGVTSAMKAVCLMPAGVEPGHEVDLSDRTFQLTVSTPVEFPIFYSSVRQTDVAGDLVEVVAEQMTTIPPIRTVLTSRKHKESAVVAVELHARLTEIGTLQVWCSERDGNRTWQLQFDIRSATQTDKTAHDGRGESSGILDQESVDAVDQILESTFGEQATEKPGGLAKRIASELELSRDAWPLALLRRVWESLMDSESGRQRSANHEARWLNLLGYALRPGFGVAMDDWRVAETWKVLRGKLCHPGPATISEWWIFWRRIAGGLNAGQQQQIANPLLTKLRDEYRKASKARSRKPSRGVNNHELSESWRMLASFERLSARTKVELGTMAAFWVNEPDRDAIRPALLWSLGRLGAREPFYGPLNAVVDPGKIDEWIRDLIRERRATPEHLLAAMMMSRRTGDRYRDIDADLRDKVLNWLSDHDANSHFVKLVETGGELEEQEGAMVFGEALPIGLQIQ